MYLALVRAFSAVVALGAVASIVVTTSDAQLFVCPIGFASFGDSLADTGNALDAFPFAFAAENLPYGSSPFFGQPAKRYTNGRLVVDFFSLAFRKPLMDAYFSVATFNFVSGANFAVVGATAAPSTTALTPFSVYPFQTSQFIRFQKSVSAAQQQLPVCANFDLYLPLYSPFLPINPFTNWLFTIIAGSNDIVNAVQSGVPFTTIYSTIIPTAIGAISTAIQTLYTYSARNILVFGVPLGGCLPTALTLAPIIYETTFPTDGFGCIIALNNITTTFNAQLLRQIRVLRSTLPGVTIAFFDYGAAETAILSNLSFYGFDPSKTLITCCGASGVGSNNYNPSAMCGMPGATSCSTPDTYISWDGFHFTEAFYKNIATFALKGLYTDGGVNYANSCLLDFSKFPTSTTFAQAYPGLQCINLYA